MITFEKVSPLHGELIHEIQELNDEVFPCTPSIHELLFLSNRFMDIPVDFLALMDNGGFRGYVYVVNFSKISYLTFLAIKPKYQGKGYGSKLLAHVKKMQGDKPIMLTAFKPIPKEDDYVECLKRKAFYEHNGFILQPDSDVELYRTCEIYLHGTGVRMSRMRKTITDYGIFCDYYHIPNNEKNYFKKTPLDSIQGKLVATVDNLNTLKRLYAEGDKKRFALMWKYFYRYDWRDQRFEQKGKVGAKDITGIVTVPPLYDDVKFLNHYFEDRSLRPVVAVIKDKEALVSTQKLGWQLTDFVYDKIVPITEDRYYFQCWKDGKTGILERLGHVVVPVEMDEIEKHGPYFKFTKGDKCGVLVHDTEDGLLDRRYFEYYAACPPIYDEIAWPSAEDNCLKVRRNGLWGYLTCEGKFTITREKCGIGEGSKFPSPRMIKLN